MGKDRKRLFLPGGPEEIENRNFTPRTEEDN
jgi:hypothetical protein